MRGSLTRMADDLGDDVEDSSGLKPPLGIFDAKPRTLSQVIAEAGRPFKKPQVQIVTLLSKFFFCEALFVENTVN